MCCACECFLLPCIETLLCNQFFFYMWVFGIGVLYKILDFRHLLCCVILPCCEIMKKLKIKNLQWHSTHSCTQWYICHYGTMWKGWKGAIFVFVRVPNCLYRKLLSLIIRCLSFITNLLCQFSLTLYCFVTNNKLAVESQVFIHHIW